MEAIRKVEPLDMSMYEMLLEKEKRFNRCMVGLRALGAPQWRAIPCNLRKSAGMFGNT